MSKTRVLIVCTGNICRSPTAEGVMRAYIEKAGLAEHVEVDSAGTHAYHVGEAPDPRSIKAAARRGFDLNSLRARRFVPEDFARFDHLLAMDRGHLQLLTRACPPQHRQKLTLFLHPDREVPDPYYGGAAGFEQVLDLVEEGARAWLERLAQALD